MFRQFPSLVKVMHLNIGCFFYVYNCKRHAGFANNLLIRKQLTKFRSIKVRVLVLKAATCEGTTCNYALSSPADVKYEVNTFQVVV